MNRIITTARSRLLTVCVFIGLIAPVANAADTAPAAGMQPDPILTILRDKALQDNTAWDTVEGLTTEVGPRPDGTEAEERARVWSVKKMKELGFQNVRIENYSLPVWQRGLETAEVIGPFPQSLRITALGNSGATPADGITLPLVYFASFNELLLAPEGSLKGKIAFVSNCMQATQDGSSYGIEGQSRFQGPNVAAKKGAAAIVIRSIGTDHSRSPHTGNTKFEDGITPIPAAALSVADAENVERMIKRKSPVILHLTLTPRQVGMRESGNVVGELPGTDDKTGIILVGGHLDSWDFGTGAIDDGAGIAITAAAARLVHSAGPHRRTIRVVWFGDEENGGHGGKAYAKKHANERHDLAAESDFGADRVWRFNTNLPDGAKSIADRLAIALEPIGVLRGSDIAGDGTDVGPTIKNGVAAIDLNQDGRRYFDWHHTAEDVLDRIDPEQLKQNIAAWTVMLAVVANAPEEIGATKPRPPKLEGVRPGLQAP